MPQHFCRGGAPVEFQSYPIGQDRYLASFEICVQFNFVNCTLDLKWNCNLSYFVYQYIRASTKRLSTQLGILSWLTVSYQNDVVIHCNIKLTEWFQEYNVNTMPVYISRTSLIHICRHTFYSSLHLSKQQTQHWPPLDICVMYTYERFYVHHLSLLWGVGLIYNIA